MVVGGLLTGVQSVSLLFVGRMVSGLGAVFVNVLMTKMVTDWFAGREIVTAMSMFVASWPPESRSASSRFRHRDRVFMDPVMYVAAVVARVCLVLVPLIYRNSPDAPLERTGRLRLDLSRREWLLISLAGFIWGSFNAGYVILISFLPELFADRGYSLPKQAG